MIIEFFALVKYQFRKKKNVFPTNRFDLTEERGHLVAVGLEVLEQVRGQLRQIRYFTGR